MSNNDRPNILAIVEAVDKINRFVAAFKHADDWYNDQLAFDATLMNFIVIGESVARLSEPLKAKYPEIPWSQIKGFRNIIAHHYFGVDAEEVWEIIQKDLPEFRKDLKKVLNSL